MFEDEVVDGEKGTIDKYFITKDMDLVAGAIILTDPKYPHNVGQTLRMCADYLAPQLWCGGSRILDSVIQLKRIPREERMKGYRDVDLIHHENLFNKLNKVEKEVIPVGVEIIPGAINLFDFEHPDNAIYLFGPEDGSLHSRYLSKCHYIVQIDTAHCLNLANAVGTVLYDRALKEHLRKRGKF